MIRSLFVASILALAFLAAPAGMAVAARDSGEAAYVKGDYATAYRIWKDGAQRGDPRALYGLGTLYFDGLGVDKDVEKGIGLMRQAAEKGNTDAAVRLGLLYGSGLGVNQDYPEAAQWLRKAADRGDARAESMLGYMYQMGQGVQQSYEKALDLYKKAANQGNSDGQLNLGFLYAKGLGTAQDFVKAHLWFNLAASQGDKTAAKNRDEIQKQMTPDQIQQAQVMARLWLEQHQHAPLETSSDNNSGSAKAPASKGATHHKPVAPKSGKPPAKPVKKSD